MYYSEGRLVAISEEILNKRLLRLTIEDLLSTAAELFLKKEVYSERAWVINNAIQSFRENEHFGWHTWDAKQETDSLLKREEKYRKIKTILYNAKTYKAWEGIIFQYDYLLNEVDTKMFVSYTKKEKE